MRINWIVILFVIAFGTMNAQDALYSQFHRTSALTNPALSSFQNGPLQFQLNFREQAGSVSDGLPLRTYYALANFNFDSFKEDNFNFGVDVFSDKGGVGHISKNIIHLNFSYLKKLSGEYSNGGAHYLSFGTQLGGGQHSVRWNRFWFGNQYNINGGFVDENLDSGEPVIENSATGTSSIFGDINLGLTWYADFSEGFSAYAGVASYHVNRPNISLFQNEEDRLSLRTNIHAGLYKSINDIVFISPQLIFIDQAQSNQTIFGSEIGIDNNDALEIAMKVGFFGRFVSNYRTAGNFDALIVTANFDYNLIRFGLSYDITVSSLSQYNNGRGAWEFNFTYTLSDDQRSGYRSKRTKFKI